MDIEETCPVGIEFTSEFWKVLQNSEGRFRALEYETSSFQRSPP